MPKRRGLLQDKLRPYYVTARGVKKTPLFREEADYDRFVVHMYAAAVGRPARNVFRRDLKEAARRILEGEEPDRVVLAEHRPLVRFFSFALGAERYHLGLLPARPGGINRYMQKLNNGYAKYYNGKYRRRGPLFSNRFRASRLGSRPLLAAALRYMNVAVLLDLRQPSWREEGVRAPERTRRFLEAYPYSSYPDLYGNRHSLLVPREAKAELRKAMGSAWRSKRELEEETLQDFVGQETVSFRSIFLE